MSAKWRNALGAIKSVHGLSQRPYMGEQEDDEQDEEEEQQQCETIQLSSSQAVAERLSNNLLLHIECPSLGARSLLSFAIAPGGSLERVFEGINVAMESLAEALAEDLVAKDLACAPAKLEEYRTSASQKLEEWQARLKSADESLYRAERARTELKRMREAYHKEVTGLRQKLAGAHNADSLPGKEVGEVQQFDPKLFMAQEEEEIRNLRLELADTKKTLRRETTQMQEEITSLRDRLCTKDIHIGRQAQLLETKQKEVDELEKRTAELVVEQKKAAEAQAAEPRLQEISQLEAGDFRIVDTAPGPASAENGQAQGGATEGGDAVPKAKARNACKRPTRVLKTRLSASEESPLKLEDAFIVPPKDSQPTGQFRRRAPQTRQTSKTKNQTTQPPLIWQEDLQIAHLGSLPETTECAQPSCTGEGESGSSMLVRDFMQQKIDSNNSGSGDAKGMAGGHQQNDTGMQCYPKTERDTAEHGGTPETLEMSCSSHSSSFDLGGPAPPATSHSSTERDVFAEHDSTPETLVMNCSNPSSNSVLERPAPPASSHLKTERDEFAEHGGKPETLEINCTTPSSSFDVGRPAAAPPATREQRGKMPMTAPKAIDKRGPTPLEVMPRVEQLLQRHCQQGAAKSKTEVPIAPAKQMRPTGTAQGARDVRPSQPPNDIELKSPVSCGKATTVGALELLSHGESSDNDIRHVLSDTDNDDTDSEEEKGIKAEVKQSASYQPSPLQLRPMTPVEVKHSSSHRPPPSQFRPMTEGDLPPLRSSSACSSRVEPGSKRAPGRKLTTTIKASTHAASSNSPATPRKATSCAPKELNDLGMGILGNGLAKDPTMLPNVATPRVRPGSRAIGA